MAQTIPQSEAAGVQVDEDLYCLWCGYNLRGLTVNRCPECGREFDLADLRRLARGQPGPVPIVDEGPGTRWWRILQAIGLSLWSPSRLMVGFPPVPRKESTVAVAWTAIVATLVVITCSCLAIVAWTGVWTGLLKLLVLTGCHVVLCVTVGPLAGGWLAGRFAAPRNHPRPRDFWTGLLTLGAAWSLLPLGTIWGVLTLYALAVIDQSLALDLWPAALIVGPALAAVCVARATAHMVITPRKRAAAIAASAVAFCWAALICGGGAESSIRRGWHHSLDRSCRLDQLVIKLQQPLPPAILTQTAFDIDALKPDAAWLARQPARFRVRWYILLDRKEPAIDPRTADDTVVEELKSLLGLTRSQLAVYRLQSIAHHQPARAARISEILVESGQSATDQRVPGTRPRG